MTQFKKIVLKNGLRILLVPQASSLAASVLILVEAGSEYETKKINGLSHFLEHMTFKGTTNRPQVGQIAEELAALGAQSNAFTTEEFTGYWAKAEHRKLKQIVDIVSDLYLNPVFNAEEIEKERGVIIEEINMYEDMPKARVQELFTTLLYGDQPAGWDVGGQKENIRKLTRDDFLKYRAARYVPSGTIVVVAGRLDEKAIVAQVKKAFGTLPRKIAPKKTKTKEGQSKPKTFLKFKESVQGHLVLGFRAFNAFDKRRYAIQVMGDLLGGGMSSRLFKKVREELGAAYYVGAGADLYLDHGFFEVAAGVDHAKIDTVITAILAECRKLTEELVPEKELQRTKDHMIGNLILSLETADELANFYGGQEIFRRPLLPPQKIIDRINAITAKDVRAVAKDIFKNKGLNLAIIGPYRNGSMFEKLLTLE